MKEKISLTDYISCPGCSSSIGLQRLKRIDEFLAAGVSGNAARSAGKIVSCITLQAPFIDEPFLFGRITAADALARIHARGGTPLTALNIAGFPVKSAAPEILVEILKGGIQTLKKAGVVLIGGHSINDPIVKCGYSITGTVPDTGPIDAAGAREGDALVLTKPLGTGILLQAMKSKGSNSLTEADHAAVIKGMLQLQDELPRVMAKLQVHAADTVGAGGLIGAAAGMARSSAVSFELVSSSVPVYGGTLGCLEQGCITDSIRENKAFFFDDIQYTSRLSDALLNVFCDAQISGGLLIAVEEKQSAVLLDFLHKNGFAAAGVIGKVLPKTDRSLLL